MTTPNTLADIRAKIRRITARPSTDQITDAQIDEYINTYYLYDLPESLRLLKLKDTFTFTTVPNIEVYQFDNTNYITCEGPAYAAGQQIQVLQDLDLFYREWPKINFIQQVSTGNGTNGPYTGTITNVPFMRSINPVGTPPFNFIGTDIRVLLSATTGGATAVSAYDDGVGGFIDTTTRIPLAGTIDYVTTGNFTITFNAPVPAGQPINASTIPFVGALPRSICFYQNQFYLRPIPDKSYLVEINAFRYPTALTDSLGGPNVPELAFWWQLIAYGAALKILVDNADFENATAFRPYFEEQLLLVQRRTIKQLSIQRASTIYSDQSNNGFSNFFPYY